MLAVAGCGDSGVRLVWPGTGGNPGYTAQSIASGARRSFGSMMICTKKAVGPTRVTSVDLAKGNRDLEVVGFATRPNPFLSHRRGAGGVLVDDRPLSEMGFSVSGPQTVGPCKYPHGNRTASDVDLIGTTELAVSLERVGAGTGTDQGLIVHYQDTRSGSHSFEIPYSMTLCSPSATVQNHCGQ
jgi:hypothetical protein